MLLSIIVPVYNTEAYVGKCIESILGQTFKDFELIIVNDGSTDTSREICEAYACKDTRVKVINQSNQGQGSARNKGLQIAKGDYIGFVDSDDWIEENMYFLLMDKARTTHADIVKCHVTMVGFEGKNLIVEMAEPADRNDRIIRWHNDNPTVWKSVCNGIYSSNLAKKIKFPEGLKFEDNPVTMLYLYYADKMEIVKVPLYNYRYNGESTTHAKGAEQNRLWHMICINRLMYEIINDEQLIIPQEITAKIIRTYAVDYYHYIKKYTIKSIGRDEFKLISENISLLRRIQLLYTIWRKSIAINT